MAVTNDHYQVAIQKALLSGLNFNMAENMAARRVHGVQRVLAKLELSVSAGNYYEAHQMYRTLYFRFVS